MNPYYEGNSFVSLIDQDKVGKGWWVRWVRVGG